MPSPISDDQPNDEAKPDAVAVPDIITNPAFFQQQNDNGSENSATSDIEFQYYDKEKDPLRNCTEQLSAYNKFKMYGIGAIMIPARIIGGIAVLSAGAALGYIANYGRPKSFQTPLRGWRRTVSKGISYLSRVLLFNYGFIWIKKRGQVDPRATVIVSNHCGPFEAAALFYHAQCTFVSRVENAKVPLLGPILRSVQCIFVNRDSVKSRCETVSKIKKRASIRQGVWPPLLIFPEGTTGNGKSIMRFRTGAFQPGIPVQPVVIKFNYKYMDPTWGTRAFGMGGLMLRIMSQFYNSLEIEFLPLYTPSEEEKQDPQLFAENVRKKMSEASGLSLSEFSLDDFFIEAEARRFNVPHEDVMLNIEAVRRNHNVSAADVNAIMRYFSAAFDVKKTGFITFDNFAAGLGLNSGELCQQSVFGAVAQKLFSEMLSLPTAVGGEGEQPLADGKTSPGISFRQFLKAVLRIQKGMRLVSILEAQNKNETQTPLSTTVDKIFRFIKQQGDVNSDLITLSEFSKSFSEIAKAFPSLFSSAQESVSVSQSIFGQICSLTTNTSHHDVTNGASIDANQLMTFLSLNPLHAAFLEALRVMVGTA